MKTWRVHGTTIVNVTVTVEAETKDEAAETADDVFGGLSGYVGNGGTDKLVGVRDHRVSLDAGEGWEIVQVEGDDA